MPFFSKEDLARWSGGKWEGGDPTDEIVGFGIDTRTLSRGEIFVAIETESRDGHDFLSTAIEKGAAGALTNRFVADQPLPQLVVSDTTTAFRRLAAEYRKTCRGTVIGITGSCGKTTVKELISLLLEGTGSVLKTEGNLNNLLGVPLTLLRSKASEAEFLIVEAGISEPGEMKELSAMIDADIAVFTSIGPAHLEDLGDLETVAREKGNLYSSSNTRLNFLGETCFPFKDHFGKPQEQVVRDERLLTVGNIDFEFDKGSTRLKIRTAGERELYQYVGFGAGFASNVALAILVARHLGVEADVVAKRLSRWQANSMRAQWIAWRGGMVFLDCYNANPLSMDDALDTFELISGDQPRLFVIGCMEELGEESAFYHRRLGKKLLLREGDFAVVVGSWAAEIEEGVAEMGKRDLIRVIDSVDDVEPLLSGFEGNIFVKGSRRYRLESVMNFIGQPVEVTEKEAC